MCTSGLVEHTTEFIRHDQGRALGILTRTVRDRRGHKTFAQLAAANQLEPSREPKKKLHVRLEPRKLTLEGRFWRAVRTDPPASRGSCGVSRGLWGTQLTSVARHGQRKFGWACLRSAMNTSVVATTEKPDRTVERQPPVARWRTDLLDEFRGTPWEFKPGGFTPHSRLSRDHKADQPMHP